MAREFTDLTVVVPANVYFDGGVTSRTLRFADGSEKTLGLMQPGEYEFGTDKPELIEITAGKVRVLLAGETEWTEYSTGDAIEVPGSSRFKITASELTDYVCSFLDD
ncbi:MAG: pyrimidine/purine nucleoside phosphorylase [Planctomycetota bacterium]